MSLSAGRGPSSHEHSFSPRVREEALQAHVEAAFREASYLPLRRIRCDYHAGVVTLRGRVPSFHLKQLAQSLVQSLECGCEVNNRVEVEPTSSGELRNPR